MPKIKQAFIPPVGSFQPGDFPGHHFGKAGCVLNTHAQEKGRYRDDFEGKIPDRFFLAPGPGNSADCVFEN